MGRNRRLDEFASPDESEADESGEEPEEDAEDEGSAQYAQSAEDARSAEDAPDADGVRSDPDSSGDPSRDPDAGPTATATYRWAPDGAACAACEATVERLWLADVGEEGTRAAVDRDAEYVCADCKEW